MLTPVCLQRFAVATIAVAAVFIVLVVTINP